MIVVSGFYLQEGSLRNAFQDLLFMGIPRDLIDVLIKKEDESLFFISSKKRKASSSVANIGRGALVGLILFAFISAGLIVASGARNSERLTWIMILGPNMGVIVGGFCGFIFSFFKKASLPAIFYRLKDHQGILMVVKSKSETEAISIEKKLKATGAQAVEMGVL